jgi:hypothetical protein
MKLLKLLFVAIVIVGAITGVLYLNKDQDDQIKGPEFDNPIANEWKEKIDSLCKEGNWKEAGYAEIEVGVEIDEKNRNISVDESFSLHKYLFACSCKYAKDGTDKLFKQTSYPDGKVTYYENMANFLKGKTAKEGNHSNLTEAVNICNAYRQLMSQLAYGASASYSRPLKAYSGGNANGRRSRIENMPYYKSHFSKNTTIREKVASIDSDIKKAEQLYYESLEKLVERIKSDLKRSLQILQQQVD